MPDYLVTLTVTVDAPTKEIASRRIVNSFAPPRRGIGSDAFTGVLMLRVRKLQKEED